MKIRIHLGFVAILLNIIMLIAKLLGSHFSAWLFLVPLPLFLMTVDMNIDKKK